MGLFRANAGEESRLSPHVDVVATPDETGAAIYDARGDDPRMVWRPGRADRAALAAQTAVRVRVEMEAVEGRLREPCVYFDWGDGFTEETRRPLGRLSGAAYSAVGHSNAGACRAVRFDPSAGPCRFRLDRFTVEGMGSASAALPRLSLPRRLARRLLRRAPHSLQWGLRKLKARLLDRPRRAAFLQGPARSLFGSSRQDPWRETYTRQFQVAQRVRSPLFAAPPLEPPRRDPDGAKIIAFYLPQYHPIPENDAWWGKGFTEWTNVAKATPQFVDHLQPRLPADLGYYDLRLPEVQHAQVDLAKCAGVDAFCFHYYWFGGRRILERPLDRFLADETLDMPFALCWANENWTRRWDGLEQDILLAQKHSPEDDLAVFTDMAHYMRSGRYFRVGGKPLLIVYRPDTLPEPERTVDRWRTAARGAGLGELFILCTDAFGFSDYARYGFDGLVEFPPHAISTGEITHRIERLNPVYSGRVYDYEAVVAAKEDELSIAEDPRRFPGVMPAWDNEARKPGAGNVFQNATPQLFRRWVSAALGGSKRMAPVGERLVIVNAWNEWAEGAYLEPDRWFGHAFSQALRSALQAAAPRIDPSYSPIALSQSRPRAKDAVVLLHIYYADLIVELRRDLDAILVHADAAISFPSFWSRAEVDALAAAFPNASLFPCENRGRDVEPFLMLLRRARVKGYAMFCKLHSKRSPHLPDGDLSRHRLIEALAGREAVERAFALFNAQPKLGLLASARSQHRLGEQGVMHNNRENLAYLSKAIGFSFDDDTRFPGGTMFWGRTAAFEKLTDLNLSDLPFETEMGRIDGALEHAFERAMGAIAEASGHTSQYVL